MILDKIADKTIERINKQKEEVSLEEVMEIAKSLDFDNDFPFEKALKEKDISFICEVKKASPSKGLIVGEEDFNYVGIAKDYQEAGASAISVLTEPFFFKGDDDYLFEIATNVTIPVLRKDFVVDKYMIYEAKILGAHAVLLICAILDENTLEKYIKIANSLGLSAVVEAHSKEEVEMAIRAGARVIGVNNRNLKNFEVDLNNSIVLRELVPKNILFISESGIKTDEDVDALRVNNVDGVLIGETLMKSPDKSVAIAYLKGKTK